MKQIYIIFILIITFSLNIFSQSYSINWNKSYGSMSDENGNFIHNTMDGGYILAGYTKSIGAGESDAWLLRINPDGDTLWTKTFGGSNWDWGQTVLETRDGGFLLAIRCYSFGAGYYDAWMIKTNSEGDSIWTKFWGEDQSEWITTGDITWDGSYIFTGRTSSFGAQGEDIWIIKCDSSGNILWNKTIGGEKTDNAGFIRETTDKGFIIVGRTYSYGMGNSDIWLVKTDIDGDTLWTKSFGGIDNEYGVSVQQTLDGGYVLVGNTSSFGNGKSDIWVIRTNDVGDTLWTKLIGGSESERAYTLNILNGYSLIGGSTESFGSGGLDGWLIVLDDDGEVYWSQTFGGEENDMILGCTINVDQEIIFTGYTTTEGNNTDLWLSNISLDYPLSTSTQIYPHKWELGQNYPNPFNPSTIIKYTIPNPLVDGEKRKTRDVELVVFDLLGREVGTLVNQKQKPGNYEVEFDGSHLTSGIYLYQLKAGDFFETKKMLLIK